MPRHVQSGSERFYSAAPPTLAHAQSQSTTSCPVTGHCVLWRAHLLPSGGPAVCPATHGQGRGRYRARPCLAPSQKRRSVSGHTDALWVLPRLCYRAGLVRGRDSAPCLVCLSLSCGHGFARGARHEHRTRGQAHDLLGDAAHERMAQTGPPVGAHDDAIRSYSLRCRNNLLKTGHHPQLSMRAPLSRDRPSICVARPCETRR